MQVKYIQSTQARPPWCRCYGHRNAEWYCKHAKEPLQTPRHEAQKVRSVSRFIFTEIDTLVKQAELCEVVQMVAA